MYETPVSWGQHYWGDWDHGWINLLRVDFASKQDANPFECVTHATLHVECLMLSVVLWGEKGYIWDIQTGLEERKMTCVGKLLSDHEELDKIAEGFVHLIPLLSNSRPQNGYNFKWHITCLVVAKTGLGHNEYRRTGLALVSDLEYFHSIDKREILLV